MTGPWSFEKPGEIRKGTRSKQSSFIGRFRHNIVYGREGAVEANIKLTKVATPKPSLRCFGRVKACLEGARC